MGVDLTLLPLIGPDFWAAQEMLRVERRPELWDNVNALPQKPIPKPLSCYLARDPKYGETIYGDIETDPYGGRPTYTTAGALYKLKDHKAVQDNWKNRAIWAFLEKLPADWPIVLYWS